MGRGGRGPRYCSRRAAGGPGPGGGGGCAGGGGGEALGGGGAGGGGVGETKVIYHLDEEETPYLVKIPVPAERITLGDFKSVLQRPAGAKYFFKSMDQDFGVVKEEISDDNARLPCFNGRVVSWLVSSDNPQPEMAPPAHESRTELVPPPPPLPPLPPERTSGIGDSRPPSFHPKLSSSHENLEPETETESVVSLRRERTRRRDSSEHGAGGHRPSGTSRLERHLAGYECSSTLMTTSPFQVNDMNFENMSNDDAVRVLRDIVHKPGPIVLTVAKCWDPSPQAYFTLPRNEPIQPIDPAAWVSHSAALTGTFPAYPGSSSMSTITSGSSLPDGCESRGLSIHMDMASVTKAMAAPESGLEVRDRMWLKITIPNAFLGSDVVDWLYHHVEGFPERREARKYASGLLKAGLIRHTVNKITFSEQCYYVFGDLSGGCESCKSPSLVWESRLSYLVLHSNPRPGPGTVAMATRVVRHCVFHAWPCSGQPWGLICAYILLNKPGTSCRTVFPRERVPHESHKSILG
ncbi:segment polarity protein dishevelled homolog DVL-2 isoform X1 [Cricetulus griseus]|uniref:segment polarity protein dishevelled homolog DVL-2 isoform X1 n=1 Tax=Cricetulus griseus TaxID=10029 RepID=UPI000F746667|nr:segment polarity protein dishevelled homolog DVL-2 isoform X1 [Cricetulus griseus]